MLLGSTVQSFTVQPSLITANLKHQKNEVPSSNQAYIYQWYVVILAPNMITGQRAVSCYKISIVLCAVSTFQSPHLPKKLSQQFSFTIHKKIRCVVKWSSPFPLSFFSFCVVVVSGTILPPRHGANFFLLLVRRALFTPKHQFPPEANQWTS